MKMLIAIGLLLAGLATTLPSSRLQADPSGAVAFEKVKMKYGGSLPQTGLIADPSETVLLKKAGEMQKKP